MTPGQLCIVVGMMMAVLVSIIAATAEKPVPQTPKAMLAVGAVVMLIGTVLELVRNSDG